MSGRHAADGCPRRAACFQWTFKRFAGTSKTAGRIVDRSLVPDREKYSDEGRHHRTAINFPPNNAVQATAQNRCVGIES